MKFGNVPPFDPTDSTMVGWAEETTLDVEYAHSIAPGAKIVLAETPVAETEGTSGLPEMMNAEKSLINHGIGDVITQSFGATENTFPGFDSGNFSSLLNLRYAFKDALRPRRHGARLLGRRRSDGRRIRRQHPVPVPGELLAVVGPAGHLGRRHHAQPGRQRQPAVARRRVERRLRRRRRRRVRASSRARSTRSA